MYDLAAGGDLTAARALYRELAPAFAWDSRHTFIQAIKLAMDLAGRYGGPCRPPRSPLSGSDEAAARRDIERAMAAEVLVAPGLG